MIKFHKKGKLKVNSKLEQDIEKLIRDWDEKTNLQEKIGEKLKELSVGFAFLSHGISLKPLWLVMLLMLSKTLSRFLSFPLF